ncbi:MAG: galactose-1-phosphate uridylyltransferase [Gemmatimonadetes bacterium]|nr:galactose-1-phosphate uridylyltransferase [Gemmatimonadota bacterium]
MRRTRLADGRYFIFYDFEREPEILQPGPASAPTPGVGELRLSEQTGEWVITAAHRQERTHLPPPEYCPLCPSRSGAPPTEVPARDYEIAVFENRFPSLWRDPPLATVAEPGWMVRPARGRAEVVLYTSDHNAVFGALSPQHIARLIEVWGQRYLELAAEEDVEYVSIFENRGEEIGVTLHHPHGQICAYPFVPPIPALEMATAARYRAQTGCCIHCDLVGRERKDGRRVVLERGGVVAFVPFAARWPYEVHVYVTRHAPHMAALAAGEVTDLAGVLRGVVAAYDALFDRPMPYVMAMHQAPTRGRSAETADAHYHVEFYPARRARDRLKFRAGGETGMGVFVNDVMPEAAAEMLRGVL